MGKAVFFRVNLVKQFRLCVLCCVGGVLLAADYSQLELRMIAHLSQDSKLIQILNGDGDVFKLITAQWKSVSVEDVTPEQRQQAKQVSRGHRTQVKGPHVKHVHIC